MSKTVRLTETELTKIVQKIVSEGEKSDYELYGEIIQNLDDDLSICIRNSLQNLEMLRLEIERDKKLKKVEKQQLLRYIEGVEDTYS